jgi:hypothetical protein
MLTCRLDEIAKGGSPRQSGCDTIESSTNLDFATFLRISDVTFIQMILEMTVKHYKTN